jgi:hypothetical protein
MMWRMAQKLNSELKLDMVGLHHKPGAVCIVCTINALTDSVYLLIDSQELLWEQYPKTSHPDYKDHSWALSTLSSSSTQSMEYLMHNLMRQETPEFEAYASIARNQIEKLTKIIEVNGSEEYLVQASHDFMDTVEDVTLLFECMDLKEDTAKLKKAKFLGRGPDWNKLPEERYKLTFAYLSRLMHSFNMDSLLHPALDRFLVRGYLLVLTSGLYHQVSGELPILSNKTRSLHKNVKMKLDGIWSKEKITPETLIYWTSFYDTKHSDKEREVLVWYQRTLDQCTKIYKKNGATVLPKVELVDCGDECTHSTKK